MDDENSYYNAKGTKEDSLDDAATMFMKLVEKEREGERTLWGFKSQKQLIKIYGKQGDNEKLGEGGREGAREGGGGRRGEERMA